MGRHRYVKDYRLNEYIDERGHVTSETEYIGADYFFRRGAGRARSSGKLVCALSAAGWACFVALVCVEGTAMRTMYVALPFAFTALPVFLLTRAAAGALRASEPLRHDEADRLSHTLPGAALWAMMLPAASFLGCLLSSALGAADWDALFLALSAAMAACGAGCFFRRADFDTEKR